MLGAIILALLLELQQILLSPPELHLQLGCLVLARGQPFLQYSRLGLQSMLLRCQLGYLIVLHPSQLLRVLPLLLVLKLQLQDQRVLLAQLLLVLLAEGLQGLLLAVRPSQLLLQRRTVVFKLLGVVLQLTLSQLLQVVVLQLHIFQVALASDQLRAQAIILNTGLVALFLQLVQLLRLQLHVLPKQRLLLLPLKS